MNTVVSDGCGQEFCKETWTWPKQCIKNKAEQHLHFPFLFNILNRMIQYEGHTAIFQSQQFTLTKTFLSYLTRFETK